jgi:membrane-bound metal-dependent hydrolase YbcI (DUF457 family)
MAIGLTLCRLLGRNHSHASWWKTLVFVALLSTLPDLDVLFGLLLQGNGAAFHRGPTHSLLFALWAAWMASHAWRLWSPIPRVDFATCFLLTISHVIADAFTSPISFFWPLQVTWSPGHADWIEIAKRTFLLGFGDYGVLVGCGFLLILVEMLRRYTPGHKRTLVKK